MIFCLIVSKDEDLYLCAKLTNLVIIKRILKIKGGFFLFKRYMAIILSITLLISILPVYAHAETGIETKDVATVEDTNISSDDI